MEEKKPDKVEWLITFENGKLYEVEKSFFMRVCDGPLVAAKKGEIVLLSERFGDEMFFNGKAIPCEMGEIFEAVTDFQTVQNGEFFRIKKGDVLKLSKDEAVTHLRKNDVRKKRGGFENES